MIRALLLAALLAAPELQEMGLEHEAFLYALRWAANYDPKAEIVVANSLIDGTGVDANPLAAIQFVCGDRAMTAYARRKLVIKANMRMVGNVAGAVRCESNQNE
jgi:hypothetical protein